MGGSDFTNRTRRTLHAAGDEAAALGHEYVGTEHILLALLHDGHSAAACLLTKLGSDIGGIEAQIKAIVKPGTSTIPAGTGRPYTSRAMRVLELAMRCARDDNRAPVGTQHLLLGLVREGKGIAAQVLTQSGVTDALVADALGTVEDVP